jgi:hypothetical protein
MSEGRSAPVARDYHSERDAVRHPQNASSPTPSKSNSPSASGENHDRPGAAAGVGTVVAVDGRVGVEDGSAVAVGTVSLYSTSNRSGVGVTSPSVAVGVSLGVGLEG